VAVENREPIQLDAAHRPVAELDLRDGGPRKLDPLGYLFLR
jgi:hypothetical protein